MFVSPVSELRPNPMGPRTARGGESKLLELYAKYHDQGLEILTIAANSPGDKRYAEQDVAKLAEEMATPWRVAYDAGRINFSAYGLHSRQFLIVIGRDGKLSVVNGNPSPDAMLEFQIRRALTASSAQTTAPAP